MYLKVLFAVLLINFSTCLARVPPRNHEIEEAAVDKPKDPIESPVERSPIDSVTNDDKLVNPDRTIAPKKPIGIILLRHQSPFSIFSNRSPHQVFSPSFSPLLNHHHHFGGSDLHDDPSLRLFSLLFGNRRFRPMPESSETEAANASSESSAESSEIDNRRDIHPLDISSIFPNILTMPKFPLDDETEKEGEATSTNENKTPVNFENKEKKVITIGGKKFVKTTQTKKVKNDFGQFHSVISSYEPFDEKVHDENGNEKLSPADKNSDSSTVANEKFDSSTVASEKVDSSTVASEKVDSSTTSDKINEKLENDSTSSTSAPSSSVEKKLTAESLSKESFSTGTDNKNIYVSDDSKNEISDKNVEIKVDQMN